MSIIHGSWISESNIFFIWGETWLSLVNLKFTDETTEIVTNSFCLGRTELTAFLQEYNLSFTAEEKDITITIPSIKTRKNQPLVPVFSQSLTSLETKDIKKLQLQNWQVTGIALTPQEAIKFLSQLPLNQADYIAPELSFWTQLYRWVLDLIVKGKFISGIAATEHNTKGIWQPLLDSEIERTRLAKFSQLMPESCLAYNSENLQEQELLLDFLTYILDAQVREWLDYTAATAHNITVNPWLRSLSESDSIIDTDAKNLQRLQNALYNWQLPLQEYIVSQDNNNLAQNRYRLALALEPPVQDKKQSAQGNWQLQYYLQALDDTDFIVDATTIWGCSSETLDYQGRSIENPQEILLKGLGLATRLYEPVANSLEETNPVSCELNPIEVYQFIRAIAWQLQNNGLGIILPPGLAPGDNEQRLGIQITAGVTQKKDTRLSLQSLLEYKLQIAVGDTTLSKAKFEKLLAQQSPIVEVDGKWLALQPADVKAAQAILNKSNEEMSLSVEDALRIATGDTKTLAKLPVVKFAAKGILEELINNLTDNKGVEPITNIKDLKGTLRPYQSRGVGWLSFLEKWSLGACLADDMGLGKTIQLTAFVLNLHNNNKLNKPTLVVCPTSVLNNWEREVQKFAPTLSTVIHYGDRRKKGKTFVKEVNKKHLVITSYSLVYRDLKTFQQVDWEGIVLDEAQNIKNPSAKQSQSVREIPTGFRIALTGTPVENRLSELWSILDFLNPGFLGTKTFFQKRFALPIEKYGDKQSLNILRSLVRPFILRRLKTDTNIIQDLPEKQEMNVFCGLTTEQAEIYQKLVDESMEKIDNAEGIQRHGLVLTLLMRLKQLCNHPELKDSKNQKSIKLSPDFGSRSGKLMRLSEMLEVVLEENDRALIFTQFSEWGKLLKLYLQTTLKTEVIFLYGATKRAQRQEMIDRFQNDPNGPKIFILSLKAGGTGLNLTKANHVFHVDRWWNPAVENQATDRAFRIGQKRNVQVHKFVCSGTLEEKINDIIESKKELAEQTVDAGEQWLTRMDTDRLRSLLLLDRDRIIDETD
ncbi:DNA/RNA helicase, superfamily II, SNF2 family [Hyella patelloides LEGE 07179]|uniref:DNA/RNA helicase, superfamily II, SNF2 family n=1 Tax=Hyella patelloides LEGE 07179 TaxID=945734 RepID=A0A563VJE0_9CYAN|nr:DEAD/DEAH box helicase [Hyella patelloides]VEP11529.1 DNA/RNA helicase, superfamily II, SNF2 family [Hyella patelloides LEGE 07179]